MGKPKKPRNVTPGGKGKAETVDDKGKKSYSFASAPVEGGTDADGLQKVVLPAPLEKRVLDLIQENHSQRLPGEVSRRLTNKKLTDVYESLSLTGFKHEQVEKTMSHVIPTGGDLMAALDWLCLFTPNDKLPEGFSETMEEEEVKKRPKFESDRVTAPVPRQEATHTIRQRPETAASAGSDGSSMKDWILRYTEDGSEEEGEDGETGGDNSGVRDDPNEKYLELTARLLDARAQASQAKQEGNKSAQREASNAIKKITTDMDVLECHKDFNPSIKIKDIDAEKDRSARQVKQPDKQVMGAGAGASGGEGEDNCVEMARMFEEAAHTPAAKKEPLKKVPLDVRDFEYTRQQWTGKSPKQFLIDWVRKHLPNSKPPSYRKTQVRGNLHRCQVTVQRKKEGDLVVTPDIVTETSKDAEHLGCTLALYHLCKGQSVYQLLPPPYRDVWLEWAEAERKLKDDRKTEKNKPRDQFLCRLLKRVQLEDNRSSETQPEPGECTEESWEDLADKDLANLEVNKSLMSRKTVDGDRLRTVFLDRQRSDRYQSLAKTRQTLPVSQYREHILESVAGQNVLVVAGETGSGKSTQIPQFILQSFVEKGEAGKCNIVCTEPRRISAVSLANRVSEELGEGAPGSPDSFCGYQIRFETKKCPTTRLTYCTTGVLLRQLQLDPLLSEVTHIIVDEVHERTMQSDFLMIVLKTVLQRRPEFRVVLMSATLDSAKFSSYFYHCPVINIPGRTFPVQVHYVEDVVEFVEYRLEEDSPYAVRVDSLVQEERATVTVTGKGGNQQQQDVVWTTQDIATIDKSGLSADQFSLKTRNTVTRLHPDRINMDLILELLKYLSSAAGYREIEGAVLVFLPGLADIQELHELLQTDKHFANPKRYKILALHSVLSSQDQSAVFTTPPPGVRKIVIATNIAETGITIPDVVYVIDAGKAKENRYVESSGLSSLEEVFVSKANAKQRQGRAGRVREGHCFRLYTRLKYESLREFSVPELVRIPLEELCLHIMKCDLGDPQTFLSQALDPPSPAAVAKAMSLLQEVGACYHGDHTLTPLGHHLAALPVQVRVGKMLVYGALLGCLQPVAVIAAAMTGKSPFVVPLNKRGEADVARQAFSVACSDHLTLYNAYLRWRKSRESGRQAELDFCNRSFLKRNSLLEIENVKNELMKLVQTIGLSSESSKPDKLPASIPRETVAMVKAVVTAGLYPNIARVTYEATVDAAANPEQRVCVMETPQGAAQAHPASVNRHLKATGFIVYLEKVKHSRVYIRDSSLISPHPILLFGGDIEVHHRQQVVTVDKWIKFQTYTRTGVIYRELRSLLNDLLKAHLGSPGQKIADSPLLGVIIELLKCDAR